MDRITILALAHAAGQAAAHQLEPVAEAVYTRGWVWWQHTQPELGVPPNAELAASAIWAFAQGARAWLQGEEEPLTGRLTGAWCALFWPTLEPALLVQAHSCYTAGAFAGARAARWAGEIGHPLFDQATIWQHAREEAARLCPRPASLTREQQESAFGDGFFATYWEHVGHWSLTRLFLHYEQAARHRSEPSATPTAQEGGL